MIGAMQGWMARRRRAWAARHWAGIAGRAKSGSWRPGTDLTAEAAALHQDLSRFLRLSHTADVGTRRLQHNATDFPPGTDWFWQPAMLSNAIDPWAMVAPSSGQSLSNGITLWHDCRHRSVILRQVRNRGGDTAARYGLGLEIMGFSGSYLSLSVDLPDDVLAGLDRDQIVRLDATLSSERAITVYGRLNLTQGPETPTLLRQLGHPVDGAAAQREAEFDLAYADLAPRPVERAWLDLIFEAPAMNAVTLHDFVLSRRPRAQM